ncbi:Cell division cycle protein 123 [Balamuthia mandrillaris]
MQMAEELARRRERLRSIETKDRSVPVLTADVSPEVKRLREHINAVNLENWYSQLQQYTFETAFLNLSLEEARSILAVHKCNKSHQPQQQEQDAEAAEQQSVLASLSQRIDEALKPFVVEEGAGGGAFVRLSSRSPKDATIAGEKTMQLFEEELERMEEREQKEEGQSGINVREDENSRLVALLVASTKVMMVRTGDEALKLFITSERSYEDLVLALEFPEKWDMKVIIRKWVDIHPSMEFRGFVYNKNLTALSQYFYVAFFPQLLKHKDSICAKIQGFLSLSSFCSFAASSVLSFRSLWLFFFTYIALAECYDKVKGLIPIDNFIIDFAILDDGQVLVIELNPYHKCKLVQLEDRSQHPGGRGPL